MNLFQLLQSRSKTFYVFLAVLGLVSSVTNLGILMLINITLSGRSLSLFGNYSYLAYAILIVVSFGATAYFQTHMTALTNNMLFDMEISIIQKIRRSSFESFQKLGKHKIYAAINDASILSRVPEMIVDAINSSVTIVCAMCYLFWVAPLGGLMVLGLMAFLLVFYLFRNRKIERDINKVRDFQNAYYTSLYDLLHGFRQLKISGFRNNNLFNNYILENRTISKKMTIRTSRKYIINQLLASYSWYIVLGIIVFLLPVIFKFNVAQVAVFIATVLFLMSPVSSLVNLIPTYTTVKVSLERIDEIDKLLKPDAATDINSGKQAGHFNVIRFQDITYRYSDDNDNTSFTFNLPDFSIYKEEILLVVGGNGSGKTTFINILTGLFKPQSGRVFIDEKELSWREFCDFSNNMAVIFSDHYLFRTNYDKHDLSENNPRLKYFRDLINLNNVLKIDARYGQFDTDLSKGQQKRVALLAALLEDKPIVILDEWAAEQDPYNKNCFYTKWLETIRNMGKTVIVVSHDDTYYHKATRLVKFEFGKITSDNTRVTGIVN